MKGKITPIYSLWLLITVALVIFIGVSFSGDIKLGNHILTKARFPETIFPEPEILEEYPEQAIDTVAQPEKMIAEPDTTIHSVLVFGDSMTHHLAMSIAKYGTKNHYKVTGVTWESSSIPGWAKSGKLKKYLEESRPDFVIISLGANEMGLKDFSRRIPEIKKIISQIGDIPYVWVGPPLWKEDHGLYKALRKGLPEGRLFETGTLQMERGPDHIHPTRRGADVWADSLMLWIGSSFHPILHEKPDSGTTTKGHKIIYLHPDE